MRRAHAPVAPAQYPRPMLWVIVGVLLLLWFLGLLLRAFGGLIHILIIVALVVIIYRLVTRGRVR
jgi:small-conductance mechanosensitive channel